MDHNTVQNTSQTTEELDVVAALFDQLPVITQIEIIDSLKALLSD